MAKKRTQAAAGLPTGGRTTTRRRAAEASTAKTKSMVDDNSDSDGDGDDYDDDDDVDVTSATTSAQLNPVKVEDMPLFAPGLRLFEGFSDTVRNTEIAALTKAEPDMEQSRKYGFTMKPLIVTEGPLAGKTILVLENTATFRFLDLPPEIRNMVYGYLIDAEPKLHISSHKIVRQPRHSTISMFDYDGPIARPGRTWDNHAKKWTGAITAFHNLLRVSKQVQAETATMIYGSTEFAFRHWNDASLFFNTIGSMRRYIQHVRMPDREKGQSKMTSVFRMLQDATELRSLVISHAQVCPDARSRWGRHWMDMDRFTVTIAPLFKQLLKRMPASSDALPSDVLDIVAVGEDKTCAHCTTDAKKTGCYDCLRRVPHDQTICVKSGGCKIKCDEQEGHCEDVTDDVRAALAKVLKIKI